MTGFIRGLGVLLGRAALVVGLLLVMGGILGMHVMATSHTSHVPRSAPQEAGVSGGLAHAASHGAVGHADHGGKPSLASESCAGSCPGMEHSGTSCIPLAKTGSLIVFPSPDGSFPAENDLVATVRPAATYSYVPASPTPCELSISRT